AKSSSLNPLSSRNAWASQKTNEPAIQHCVRLRKFQKFASPFAQPVTFSRRTVAPPAKVPRNSIWPARSPKSQSLGKESTSMKTTQFPGGTEGSRFRGLEIWLIGSQTTFAPSVSAMLAVRSVELLSQTISSLSHPSVSKAHAAFLIAARQEGSNRSSLKA